MNWPPPNTPTARSCTWAPECATQSVHSLLGAIGFAASALAFAARDEWIGWQSQMRRKRLRCVPILSRLLIRPASLPSPSQGGVPVPPRAASPGVECHLVPVNQGVL